MVRFKTIIQRFDEMGEKTGWTYIVIPAAIAVEISNGSKKSFNVKGKLDNYKFEKVSLLPMGKGSFIMPLNQQVRKKIGKSKGHELQVEMVHDKTVYELNIDFMECLEDEPTAKAFFETLTGSHQRYFSKWIESAKTEPTRAKRILMAVKALAKKGSYADMLHWQRDNKLT